MRMHTSLKVCENTQTHTHPCMYIASGIRGTTPRWVHILYWHERESSVMLCKRRWWEIDNQRHIKRKGEKRARETWCISSHSHRGLSWTTSLSELPVGARWRCLLCVGWRYCVVCVFLCRTVWHSDTGAFFLPYTPNVGKLMMRYIGVAGARCFLSSFPFSFTSLRFLSQRLHLLKTDNGNWEVIFALLSVRFTSVYSVLMDVPYEPCPL